MGAKFYLSIQPQKNIFLLNDYFQTQKLTLTLIYIYIYIYTQIPGCKNKHITIHFILFFVFSPRLWNVYYLCMRVIWNNTHTHTKEKWNKKTNKPKIIIIIIIININIIIPKIHFRKNIRNFFESFNSFSSSSSSSSLSLLSFLC